MVWNIDLIGYTYRFKANSCVKSMPKFNLLLDGISPTVGYLPCTKKKINNIYMSAIKNWVVPGRHDVCNSHSWFFPVLHVIRHSVGQCSVFVVESMYVIRMFNLSSFILQFFFACFFFFAVTAIFCNYTNF